MKINHKKANLVLLILVVLPPLYLLFRSISKEYLYARLSRVLHCVLHTAPLVNDPILCSDVSMFSLLRDTVIFAAYPVIVILFIFNLYHVYKKSHADATPNNEIESGV